MTHDELLAAVQFNKQTLESSDRNSEALRAVVELHKPDPKWDNCMGCQETDGGWYDNCPTIQAIKEQLK